MKNFLERASELKGELIEQRRFVHQNAELTNELPITTRYVMEKLSALGLEPKEICKSAVVATIAGEKPGKTILLRADMDALPMDEHNALPFKSQFSGQAHTCGHDLHTSMLLSAAKMLLECKDVLQGNVKLMFQPAEEIFAGSSAMLENGLMENPKVDASVDLHVMTELPVGTVTTRTGFVTASCDGFKIVIRGKGCHGAQPQNGVDPINVGAHMHIALQELIARECPPNETAVLTIGQFVAGTTANIIPDVAVMQGTMRTYNKDLRVRLYKRLQELVEHTAKAFGAEAAIEVLSDVPSIYANPAMMESCTAYIQALSDDFVYNPDYIVTASDDYARIADFVPSVFFAIGASPDDIAERYPNHNPNVIFNEECLPIGAAIYAQCAHQWLQENA